MIRHHHCFIGPGACIHRRALELEEGRDPNYRYVGDFEYWHRLGFHGPFRRIPRILAKHRVHPVSTSAESGVVKAEEHMRLVTTFFSREDLPSEVLKVKREAFSNAAYLAARTLMPTSSKLARKYFIDSLRYDLFSYFKWRPSRMIMVMTAFLPERLAAYLRRTIERLVGSTIYFYVTESEEDHS
jgi:hypothetical protein